MTPFTNARLLQVTTATFALIGTACSTRVNEMQLVCEAGERSGAAKVANPADRASHVWRWIEANVHDKEIMKGLRGLGTVDAKDRGEILRLMAKENGYTGPCPMADEAAADSAAEGAKPTPQVSLFGWWVVTDVDDKHKALRGAKIHIAADEIITMLGDATWDAHEASSVLDGSNVSITGRTPISDNGTHGRIEHGKLVLPELVAIEAQALANQLDRGAATHLPPRDTCARALACAKKAAPIQRKLELLEDPVHALDGAGRARCATQRGILVRNYEAKKLPVPDACK